MEQTAPHIGLELPAGVGQVCRHSANAFGIRRTPNQIGMMQL